MKPPVELDCAQVLQETFTQWQGEPHTRQGYAAHLSLHEVTLNRLMSGRRKPSIKMLIRLAKATDDPRFYQLAGIPPIDDPLLQHLSALWPRLSAEIRRAIVQQAEENASENEHPAARPQTQSPP